MRPQSRVGHRLIRPDTDTPVSSLAFPIQFSNSGEISVAQVADNSVTNPFRTLLRGWTGKEANRP